MVLVARASTILFHHLSLTGDAGSTVDHHTTRIMAFHGSSAWSPVPHRQSSSTVSSWSSLDINRVMGKLELKTSRVTSWGSMRPQGISCGNFTSSHALERSVTKHGTTTHGNGLGICRRGHRHRLTQNSASSTSSPTLQRFRVTQDIAPVTICSGAAFSPWMLKPENAVGIIKFTEATNGIMIFQPRRC